MLLCVRSLSSLLGAGVILLSLSACGDGGSGSGTGGTTSGTTTDGKYHPTASGAHETEKAACDALVNAQEKKLLALKCVGTGQTCPSFLRSDFMTACMEYDQGSVNGCIAYYNQQSTCDGLKAAIDACVVTPYPGSEPKGCSDIDTGGTGGTTTTSSSTSSSSGGTGGTTSSGGTGGATGGAGGATNSGGTGGTTTTAGTGGM